MAGRRRRGTASRGPDRGALYRFLAFALVTGFLTVAIGNQILGASLADRYTLTATFDDVTGLLTGDQVKVSGAPVGKVTEIGVAGGRAVVEMEVDRAVRVPVDSTAAVRWRNMAGQRMVYLIPGREQTMLGDGARVRHTQSVVDLSEVVNSLGPLTRSLDPQQLNKVLNAFAQSLDGNSGNVNLMIGNLEGLLQTFSTRKTAITQMTRDFKTVSDAVAQRDRQIAQSIDNLQELTEVFARNDELLQSAVLEISGVTTSLNQVLGGNEVQLGRIIRNLTEFTDTARLNLNQLEKLVQNLPLALRQLFAAANGGHFLRTNVICLNLSPGECPWKMEFPSGNNGSGASQQELKRLEQILKGQGAG
ncbi:virulence factor Mce family protein [Actinomadura craniellae]|uniref:Virulence factor Mce family protein n=1 Tax=Actinomadura craniellae TaxID=2231787 RepID=A0A365HC53_9ACTN|nr:MlaD family protein [Actinomadura craniellae]RAY15843.1 virulence factor Mce family protein [Actinomadura craniellae]